MRNKILYSIILSRLKVEDLKRKNFISDKNNPFKGYLAKAFDNFNSSKEIVDRNHNEFSFPSKSLEVNNFESINFYEYKGKRKDFLKKISKEEFFQYISEGKLKIGKIKTLNKAQPFLSKITKKLNRFLINRKIKRIEVNKGNLDEKRYFPNISKHFLINNSGKKKVNKNLKTGDLSKEILKKNITVFNHKLFFSKSQNLTEPVEDKKNLLRENLKLRLLNNYKYFHPNSFLNRFVNESRIQKKNKKEVVNFADIKENIPLTNWKIKKTNSLQGIRKVEYQIAVKSFQIKIPLGENLVVKIKAIRNNFYARISAEGQTANLLIQNLQTVAQQIANLGFSKAVIGLYTSGSAGKGFSGQRGSEDGNNKHKNAEKVSKSFDKNSHRVNSFRYLL